jgi:hypothetical protein
LDPWAFFNLAFELKQLTNDYDHDYRTALYHAANMHRDQQLLPSLERLRDDSADKVYCVPGGYDDELYIAPNDYVACQNRIGSSRMMIDITRQDLLNNYPRVKDGWNILLKARFQNGESDLPTPVVELIVHYLIESPFVVL